MDFSDPWVVAALSDKLDRDAYQQHLSALGDPRGELLALAIRLSAHDSDEPEARARIAELRADVDHEYWWKLFAPPGWVLGCGGKERHGLLKMAVECERSWAEMTPTNDPQIRSCDACHEHVFRVTTRTEAAEHAQLGHCISAEGDAVRAIHSSTQNANVTGRPHAPSYWARSINAR